MLWAFRLREVDAMQPERRAMEEKSVRAGIRLLPDLARAIEVESVVTATTEFLMGRAVDWLYLSACKTVPGLMDEVVAYQGSDQLRRAMDAGPVILAPFHFGPSEFLIGGIARHLTPVTIVVSDRGRSTVTDSRKAMRMSATGDIKALRNGTVTVLLSCLQSLRGGRPVMIFPEMSFSTGAGNRVPVPFGGRTLHVPSGVATLAATSGAAVLPCHIERPAPGYYRYVIGEPMPSGADLTEALFAHCESLIRAGRAAEWEFWPMVPRLLRGQPAPRSWPGVIPHLLRGLRKRARPPRTGQPPG
ncbi:MAG TPA: hypothetical protein VGG16_05775 [Streptosporangiaceae bacterium]|jgi:lauroyl/myristoyl acyltransferase